MIEKRKIALVDIDKTIFDGYILFPLIKSLAETGVMSPAKAVKVDDLYLDYKEKKIDYETFARLVLIEWALGLKGVHISTVEGQTRDLVNEQLQHFFPFVNELFESLRPSHNIYFTTGEPQFVAEAVNKIFSVDGYLSTEFEVDNEIFTGGIQAFLASKNDKQLAVSKLGSSHNFSNSFAFGDSEADIEMLESVEHAFPINPSPGLREVATIKGWEIVTPDTIVFAVNNRLRS